MKMVRSQNYFTFLSNVYQPTKGVVLDSPISNTKKKGKVHPCAGT